MSGGRSPSRNQAKSGWTLGTVPGKVSELTVPNSALAHALGRKFRRVSDAAKILVPSVLGPHGYSYDLATVKSFPPGMGMPIFTRMSPAPPFRWLSFQTGRQGGAFIVEIGISRGHPVTLGADAYLNTGVSRIMADAHQRPWVMKGVRVRLDALVPMDERKYQDPEDPLTSTDCWWTFGEDNSKIAQQVLDACVLFQRHSDPWFARWAEETKRLWATEEKT